MLVSFLQGVFVFGVMVWLGVVLLNEGESEASFISLFIVILEIPFFSSTQRTSFLIKQFSSAGTHTIDIS